MTRRIWVEYLIRYVPAVYRLFVKKTADIELSRELCSELQLRFLKGKLTQGFDPAKGPFRFYLWRASINLLRDYFRDKRNHPIHGSLDFEPVDENEGDPFGEQDAEIHEALCRTHPALLLAGTEVTGRSLPNSVLLPIASQAVGDPRLCRTGRSRRRVYVLGAGSQGGDCEAMVVSCGQKIWQPALAAGKRGAGIRRS